MDEDLWWEHFARWPLGERLELVAFEAMLAGVPPVLVESI